MVVSTVSYRLLGLEQQVNRLRKERITMRWNSWHISKYWDWKQRITIISYFLWCYKAPNFKRKLLWQRRWKKKHFLEQFLWYSSLQQGLGKSRQDTRREAVFWFLFSNVFGESFISLWSTKLHITFLDTGKFRLAESTLRIWREIFESISLNLNDMNFIQYGY